MHPFVRFIFITLAAAVVVNLAFVLAANNRSHNRKAEELKAYRAQFKNMLELIDGRLRRADLIVEEQRINRRGVLETTLLVRQYKSTGNSQAQPRPVERFQITGDLLHVDGLLLKFDSLFGTEGGRDDEDLKPLAGKQIAYFARFYGSEPIIQPPKPDPRFTFIQPVEVPPLTQLDPLNSKLIPGFDPSIPAEFRSAPFELRVWQTLWRIIGQPPRDTSSGSPALTATHSGLTFTWLKPAARTVRVNQVYSAFVDTSGVITIDENPHNTLPGLQDDMIEQMRRQESPPGAIEPQ